MTQENKILRQNHGSRKNFFEGEPRSFFEGAKSGEISFSSLETMKNTFLLEIQKENAKFKNQGGYGPPTDAHGHNTPWDNW